MTERADSSRAEDGYELWLRYRKVTDAERLAQYCAALENVAVLDHSPTAAIIKAELLAALPALLDRPTPLVEEPGGNALIVASPHDLAALGAAFFLEDGSLGDEGYAIRSCQLRAGPAICIAGNAGPARLRGVFDFLRRLQTHRDIRDLNAVSRPRIRRRILTHWDNLNGTIERGYAGRSLWRWDELPGRLDPRYRDYARSLASVGLNGVCLTNVNAGAASLARAHLTKVAALADGFRPYGIRIYLAPDFAAPQRLGGLDTSDPRSTAVAAWWRELAREIYRLIPDFGGFQVKANSEGRSGPLDYGAGHHDGANMLADALAPYGGIVLWRAFVYDVTTDADRAKCAYKEFAPLDAAFRPNVMLEVKNGPIDFQPREPFHPLFGALKHTPLALELQVTQEYLGQSTHLVYLGPMWQEVLASDTYAGGPGWTVARVVDGSLLDRQDSCITAVSNTGADRNWCGHHFAQANWYAFGRLAWDHTLPADAIADEWVRMTWSNDPAVVETIKGLMLGSWAACINYMTPLGLHHLMQEGHHYGPDPGFAAAPRIDWSNVYFHRADRAGLGFDRSSRGSNAVSQYHSPLCEQFDGLDTCPEELLAWFHHVPWDHRLRSGRTFWQELQVRYDAGVAYVDAMAAAWQGLAGRVDAGRHAHVSQRLAEQAENARLWRQTCIDYFRQFVE